jgi:integrase
LAAGPDRVRRVDSGSGGEAPKGHALPAGHWVDDQDWSRLFACIAEDSSAAGVRDLAIFALLRGSGCRRGELAALDLDDWDHNRAVLRFRTAKGNRRPESACPDWAREPMAAYLRLRGRCRGRAAKLRGWNEVVRCSGCPPGRLGRAFGGDAGGEGRARAVGARGGLTAPGLQEPALHPFALVEGP